MSAKEFASDGGSSTRLVPQTLQAGSLTARRQAGTGSLFVRRDKADRESWYGKFRVGERQVKQRIGPVRPKGSADGLTKRQAEKELQRVMREAAAAPRKAQQRLTFQDVADQYVDMVEAQRQRKRATVQDYRIIVRRHLGPFFAGKRVDAIDSDLVTQYMLAKNRLAANTVRNHLALLHGILGYAVKNGWATSNPVAQVERPRIVANSDIRFLTEEEVEAVLRVVPDDELGPLDRTLYLTAVQTGLRRGELLALRWRDVDFEAGVVRVRQTYSRGRVGRPKTSTSERWAPMPDRVAGALDLLHQATGYQGADDLVFAWPTSGGHYDPKPMLRRFKAALGCADVRPVRFHDLRHTYGTRMAAAGTPMRALQEFMGHADIATTQIYAAYSPDPSGGRQWAEAAFGQGTAGGTNMSERASTLPA